MAHEVRTLADIAAAPPGQLAFRLFNVDDDALRGALGARFPALTDLDLQYQTLYVEDVAAVADMFREIRALNLHSGSIFAHQPSRADDDPHDEGQDHDEAPEERHARHELNMIKSAAAFTRIHGLMNLVELNLHDSKLYEGAAAVVLANLPRQCPSLEVLDLSDNGLYLPGHMTLIGVLSRLPRLRKLVLHNTHLEMDVLPFLALALGNTQALAELDLTGNYIGAEQMAPLMAHAPAALVITL